jgi:hypothetical protein
MAFAKDATVASGLGKWLTLDDGRRTLLDVFDSREKAHERLLELAITAGKLKWRLHTRASVMLLGTAQSPEKAEEEVQALQKKIDAGSEEEFRSIGRAQRGERALVWIMLLVGAAMGSGGTYVVWSRARRTDRLHHPQRPRPHVPEHPTLPGDAGHRERPHGHGRAAHDARSGRSRCGSAGADEEFAAPAEGAARSSSSSA